MLGDWSSALPAMTPTLPLGCATYMERRGLAMDAAFLMQWTVAPGKLCTAVDARAVPPLTRASARDLHLPRAESDVTSAVALAGLLGACLWKMRRATARRAVRSSGQRPDLRRTTCPGASAARSARARSARPASGGGEGGGLDVAALRAQFPALNQEVRPGVPLIYLDNAATSQKPTRVLAELQRFYQEDNSNVHRGMHTLSVRSTEAFEAARAKVAGFINAPDVCEVIFTRNATEAINVVARTWARANVKQGDEIILTVMEHHSNIVPWQQIAREVGAVLQYVGLTQYGTLDRDEFERLLGPRTRLVSMAHVSNVLGCVNPIEWVAGRAHAVGAKLLVDACQSLPHMPVDVQRLGADWLVASSHKMCGPTGMGFLWGRAELLRAAPPFLGGGEMIDEVHLDHSTFADIPHKLEAGTPAFAEAVALGTACDFLSELGMERLQEREHALTEHLWKRITELPGVVLYGPPPSVQPHRASLCSFNVEGCHPNDLATLVDQDRGIAMRAGHQCCQPLHRFFGVTASARLSAYFYNTVEEIDVAVEALKDAIDLLLATPNPSFMDLKAPARRTPS